jgi:hypothetical protein
MADSKTAELSTPKDERQACAWFHAIRLERCPYKCDLGETMCSRHKAAE